MVPEGRNYMRKKSLNLFLQFGTTKELKFAGFIFAIRSFQENFAEFIFALQSFQKILRNLFLQLFFSWFLKKLYEIFSVTFDDSSVFLSWRQIKETIIFFSLAELSITKKQIFWKKIFLGNLVCGWFVSKKIRKVYFYDWFLSDENREV